MRTSHYSPNTSHNADKLATFRQQMADFARGQRLRALRDERHLSQEDAAHEIGVSTKALRAWEKGGKIKWPNAKAAGRFYKVDPESLVARDNDDLPMVIAEQEQGQLDRIEEKLDRILETLKPPEESPAEGGRTPPTPPHRERKSSGKSAPRKRRAA